MICFLRHSWPLLLSCFFILSACNHRESTQRTEIQQDTISKGTPVAEYVTNLFLDNKGDIWMGTMSGLVQLHQNKLTYFTTNDGLAGNEVPSIAQDKEGNLWIGTHTGASRFDGKTFTNFGPEKGINGMGCKVFVDSKGKIWAGTNAGLALFNGQTFDRFELPIPKINNPYYKWELGKIWAIMEDSKGNMWFGRDGYGACKYDGQNFTLFTQNDGLVSNIVAAIAEDKQGNIWFGSITADFPENQKVGGVSRYDGEQFQQFPEVPGFTESDIYSIFQAPRGDLWICSVGHGAYRYDGQQFERFSQTDRPDLIQNFAIQSWLQDYNGQLWFGFSGGLFQFDGKQFIHRPKEYFSGEPEK